MLRRIRAFVKEQRFRREYITAARCIVEARGLEPLTLGLQSRCSSQLSYAPSVHIKDCNLMIKVLQRSGKGRTERAGVPYGHGPVSG